MFKSKKGLYIAISLNLIIWGYVGYVVCDYLRTDDDIIPTELPVNFSKKKKSDSTTYSLALNYPDPFLKEEPRPRNNNTSKSANNTSKPIQVTVPQKTITEVPKSLDIKYMGLVENKTSGAATGLVSINGKSFLVKKGEKVEGILIKTLSSEKMEVKIGKENLL